MASSEVPASTQSLLVLLRTQSHVDIDSLDSSCAKALGPFTDSTSNQAIAYGELSGHHYRGLLQNAARVAQQEWAKYPETTLVELAVEVATVLLSLKMMPHINGKCHIQANPVDAYSQSRTIKCAQRLIALASTLEPHLEQGAVCVKIASTWEGFMACKELQAKGIHTLATTLFTIEQAALAAEVACSYVAPYVNELKVHFEPSYVDPAPNTQLCVDIQDYYLKHGFRTKVLPASLTSIKEVMSLAGAQHITVAPALLKLLASTPVDKNVAVDYPSLYRKKVTQFSSADESPPATRADGLNASSGQVETVKHALGEKATAAGRAPSPGGRISTNGVPAEKLTFLQNEPGYRLAVTRRDNGRQEKKLIDAINIFCDKQAQLEELVTPYLQQKPIGGAEKNTDGGVGLKVAA